LRLYHLSKEGLSAFAKGGEATDAGRFFSASLIEYLAAEGGGVPSALKSGEAPAVRKGPHGKPYFSDRALEGVFFSLSHTRGHAAVAFAGEEIGLDCENIAARPLTASRCGRIARRCFLEDELSYVFGGCGDGRDDGDEDGNDAKLRFFEIWTAKEAYMKYTGNGFSEGFRTFSALAPPPGIRIERRRLAGAEHIVYAVCAAGAAIADGESDG
jgi:phosphopantetheinyl transferase